MDKVIQMVKKSNYWQERFLEEEERINKDARAYAKRIEQQYDMALRNIERDITDWYGRIARNNNVSLLEAKRMLSAKELAEFKWNVKEYIKAGEANAISPIWMKELENASARVHISRLEALKIQIQNEVEGIYGVRDKEMQNYLVRTYGETYYHTVYEIQKGNEVGWSLNRLDTNKVNTIIHKPWATDGKNFSDRIWEDKTKLVNSLHTGLTQNFIRGEAPDKLISSITKEFNIKKSAAARLVMTESAAYSSQAREKSFKSIGVKKYEVVATLDNKTSEICQDLDGKVFDVKDYQVGVTAPPFHPNCRTVTAPWFSDDIGERAARGTDGKTYYVPADMTYKDWREKYVLSADNSKISLGSTPVFVEKLNRKGTIEDLEKYEKDIVKSDIENAYVICDNKEVYRFEGTPSTVDPTGLGERLKNSLVTHNHPIDKTWFSFSAEDIRLFLEKNLNVLRGIDEEYIYQITCRSDTIRQNTDLIKQKYTQYKEKYVFPKVLNGEIDIDYDEYHTIVEILSEEYSFDYVRIRRK